MRSSEYKKGSVLFGRYEVVSARNSVDDVTVLLVRDSNYSDQIFLFKLFPSRVIASEEKKKSVSHNLSLLRQISHPHIQTIYDFGFTENGELYLVQELVHESLKDKFQTSIVENPTRPFSFNQVLGMLYQVLLGLNCLHSKGFLHLTISPSSIHFTKNEELKLDICGLANIYHQDDLDNYASPEFLVNGELTPAADIYSLGVLSYELLTGKHPYDFTSIEDLIQKQKEKFPLFASEERGIPGWFEEIILTAVSFNPLDRLPSARALALSIAKHSSLIKNQIVFSDYVLSQDGTARHQANQKESWELGSSSETPLTRQFVDNPVVEKKKSFISRFIFMLFSSCLFVLAFIFVAIQRPEIGDKVVSLIGPIYNGPFIVELKRDKESLVEYALETDGEPEVVEPLVVEVPKSVLLEPEKVVEVVVEDPEVVPTVEINPTPLPKPVVTSTPAPVVEPAPLVTQVPKPSAVETPKIVKKTSKLLASKKIEIVQSPSKVSPKPAAEEKIQISPKKPKKKEQVSTAKKKIPLLAAKSYAGALTTITDQREKVIRDLNLEFSIDGESARGKASISGLGEFSLSGQVVERGLKFSLKNQEVWITLVGGKEIDGVLRGFYTIPSQGKRGSWEVRRK